MKKYPILLMSVCLLGACSVIDEDLSSCGADINDDPSNSGADCMVSYELRLVTNLNTELQTVLSAESDREIADALRKHLAGIFSDHAHDVDLSFYDVQGDSVRLQHDQHVIDANQATITIYLPVREYMHLVAANVADNSQVSLADDEYCHRSRLLQAAGDTLPSQTTGLFTARLPMSVVDGRDQSFNARLYMANCAAALVLDTTGVKVTDLQLVASGFASQFSVCDSAYTFQPSAVVCADRVPVENDRRLCFCTVNFPSSEKPATRVWIETTTPFETAVSDAPLWQYQAFVTLPDGSVTKTTLDIFQPLRAGQLKIIKAKLLDDGSISTRAQNVGINVTLDWHPGGEYNPRL